MDENIHKFMNYLDEPVTTEFINRFYEAYNIKHDRVRLFDDFASSLTNIMVDTYMGDDITNKAQRKAHFRWCWVKNMDNFKLEGIEFADIDLFDYFNKLMNDIFYTTKKGVNNVTNIRKLWSVLFAYNNTKSAADLEMLLFIYNLMENSLISLDNTK